ncbi:hypothetical protein N9W34_06685 [Rickettsiales bacterium]|nr:hypothetical protein [Rickettsiales bacterium]
MSRQGGIIQEEEQASDIEEDVAQGAGVDAHNVVVEIAGAQDVEDEGHCSPDLKKKIKNSLLLGTVLGFNAYVGAGVSLASHYYCGSPPVDSAAHGIITAGGLLLVEAAAAVGYMCVTDPNVRPQRAASQADVQLEEVVVQGQEAEERTFAAMVTAQGGQEQGQGHVQG